MEVMVIIILSLPPCLISMGSEKAVKELVFLPGSCTHRVRQQEGLLSGTPLYRIDQINILTASKVCEVLSPNLRKSRRLQRECIEPLKEAVFLGLFPFNIFYPTADLNFFETLYGVVFAIRSEVITHRGFSHLKLQ